jgi:NOL1/NOP2/fmu family ribosome biogenesis protein/precorrin-6B methylase 2
MQEPSASAAVQGLDIKQGMRVLDLCAAPGSKSTQIAELLEDGFLIANEYDSKRAQILLSNFERMGVDNFLCTNMDTKVLCSQLPGFFDRILVDAPCSGEGMMKKHEKAWSEWSLDNIELCADRQKEILTNAWIALKPGGRLVYSTCTYAKEENEAIVSWLLETFPDAKQVPFTDRKFGRTGYPYSGIDETLVRRIYPMDGGDGHFMAAFEKTGEETAGAKENWLKPAKLEKEAADFIQQHLSDGFTYYQSIKKDGKVSVYGMDQPFLKLKKGNIIRQGVYIGDIVKGRFEPAHAFFLSEKYAKHGLSKTKTDLEQMDAFYHGSQLSVAAPRGYRGLCYNGIPYGFGKSDGSRITNKLPKGLRLLEKSHLKEDAQTEA